jgi:hypothetical protein
MVYANLLAVVKYEVASLVHVLYVVFVCMVYSKGN